MTERKHRHILEMVRTFLIDASMPAYFWVDAAYAALYTINRLPTPVLNKNHCLKFYFEECPIIHFLNVLGVRVF